MKVSVNREKFLNVLQIVSGVALSRFSARPILQDVRIILEKGKMLMVATDTEVGIKCVVETESGDDKGEVCIPVAKLKDIITALTDEIVTIKVDGNNVNVLAKGRNFKMLGDNPEEFPELPAFKPENAIELERETFQKMIRKTVYATTKEQMHYALNGVYMNFGKDKLDMAATDRRRLAVAKQKIKKNEKKVEPVIVPTKFLHLGEKLMDNGPDNIFVSFSEAYMMMKIGDIDLSALLIEGTFPNYNEVVPKNMPIKLDLNKEMLMLALRQAQLLADEQSKTVNLEFQKNKMRLTSRSSEEGEAEIVEEIKYDGENFKISFNPDFLLDVLKVSEEENIVAEFKDPMSAGVLRESPDFFCVISPIKPQE